MAWFRFRWSARGFVILWTIVVIVTWNLVFDREIVLAGRSYIGAATAIEQLTGQALLISAWMPRAVDRALYTATAAAGAVTLVGLGIFTWADRSRSRGAS